MSIIGITGPSPFDKLPPEFLCHAEATIGDRLVTRAVQLMQNQTAITTKNFMSTRCKMDGMNYITEQLIQSGSFKS